MPGASLDPMAGPCVVTIGNFDGVHLGHRYVIACARELAGSIGAGELPVVAVTFDPHPLSVIAPEHAPQSLTSLETRITLLKNCGIDRVYVLAFSVEMSAWTPEEFVQRIIVDQIHAAGVVVGENFRFGHKAAGDCDFLRDAGGRFGFVVEAVSLRGEGPPWSSTLVRESLANGNVEQAAVVLGRPHEVAGVVVKGDQRGTELGFPTANIPAPDGLVVPADGVYAGWFSHDGIEPMPAAISVGSNPTFDGVERRIESYVLDRDDLDLYGKVVTVGFVAKIRDQVKFDGVGALVESVRDDVAQTRILLDL